MVETLRNNLVKRWNYSKEDAEKSVIRFDIQKTEELFKGNWSDESVKEYGRDNNSLIVEKGMDQHENGWKDKFNTKYNAKKEILEMKHTR